MIEKIYYLVAYDDGYNCGSYHFDETVKNELLSFLKIEGFSCKKVFWGCPWYFIDIENKRYYPGRPGVSYGKVIGNHAITFDEFLTIYHIFKQYEGLDVLKMNNDVKLRERKKYEKNKSR